MSLVQRLNLGKKHILKKCLYVYNSVSLPILCIITLLYQPNMVSYRHSSSLWLAEVCDWFTSLFVLGLWRLATGHRTSPSAVLRHALLENIYKKYIRVRYISKYVQEVGVSSTIYSQGPILTISYTNQVRVNKTSNQQIAAKIWR